MGQTRTVAEIISDSILDGLHGFRRHVASMPLGVLIPITILAAILVVPLGVVLGAFVWLARHSWNYEQELAELYDADSPELAEFTQSPDG